MNNHKKYRLEKITENSCSRSPTDKNANSPLLKPQTRINLSSVRESYF